VVLDERIDLHRFGRHVIHHDWYWNPSTLKQQTGRLDRIRCKAEVYRLPIHVYQPFIAGSADEKMFRVIRDREWWFQIVMGRKFTFDEATSASMASRQPMRPGGYSSGPSSSSKRLGMSLAPWRTRRMVRLSSSNR
jgi:hypothetical protein